MSLIAGLLLLDAGLLALMLTENLNLLTFLWGLLLISSIPAIAAASSATLGLLKSRYHLEGGRLTVSWGSWRLEIDLGLIQGLHICQGPERIIQFRGLRWPGCLLGWGQVALEDREPMPTLFFASRPLADQVLIVTQSKLVAVSPSDRELFMTGFEALPSHPDADQGAGLNMDLQPNYLLWAIWSDRLAQILFGSAVLINGVQIALLTGFYGRLPGQVPLHFNQLGEVDRWGAPVSLFILPLVGLVAWLTAGALGFVLFQLRHEKQAAYVLWGGTIAIELATWVALAGLLM